MSVEVLQKDIRTTSINERVREIIANTDTTVAILILLLLLFLAVFQRILWYVPGDPTDLVFLSYVAKINNPLISLIKDTALFPRQNQYRPLPLISYWCTYRIFGVSAGPNQAINLTLHFMNICFLLKIIRAVQKDQALSFLLVSLALISIYTISPASWISDRATLFVTMSLLLLVNHFLSSPNARPAKHLAYIAGLSTLALLSKESGVIVPIFALVAVLGFRRVTLSRVEIVSVFLLILGAYSLLRLVIFGSNVQSYSAAGYLYGTERYDQLSALPTELRLAAFAENVIKNSISTILPAFDNLGSLKPLTASSGIIPIGLMSIAAISLFAVASTRKLSLVQKYALVLIALNSLIHYQVFRHRIQYISEFAFCLFVASSPALVDSVEKRVIAKSLAVVLLLISILSVNTAIQNQWLRRYDQINKYELSEVDRSRVDDVTIKRVLARYKVSEIGKGPEVSKESEVSKEP